MFKRGSIRLRGYDYTQPGAYFITLCTFQRFHLFGKIIESEMKINLFGQIVIQKWRNIPNHFKNARLFEFQIMPDHFHGIIFLTDKNDYNCAVVGTKHSRQDLSLFWSNFAWNASPLLRRYHMKNQPQSRFNGTTPGSIPAIIQNFSSITTRKINQIRRTPGLKIWQRGYYEHIIRNEKEYYAISKYIINNPIKWGK